MPVVRDARFRSHSLKKRAHDFKSGIHDNDPHTQRYGLSDFQVFKVPQCCLKVA
jgi:hypothetical protein